jgi:hypothetical protein
MSSDPFDLRPSRIGRLRVLLGAPELHHSAVPRTLHNFSNLAPWTDVLFGTYHCPPRQDHVLGVSGEELCRLDRAAASRLAAGYPTVIRAVQKAHNSVDKQTRAAARKLRLGPPAR